MALAERGRTDGVARGRLPRSLPPLRLGRSLNVLLSATVERRLNAHPALFRDLLARSAELCGKIFQLREFVSYWQNGFGVIDVHAGSKLQRGQCGCEHVD